MRRRKVLLAVLGLIMVAGFLLRMFPVRTGYHYWDETVYLQHGEILAGDSPNNYNEFDFRPPLFSLILGAAFTVSNSLITAHLAVAALSTFGIAATYFVAEQLYGREVGIISSIIYALSPLAIKLSHEVLVDAVLPTLWLLTAFFLIKAVRTERPLNYGMTGVAAGLAVLMKFTSLVILPGIAFLLLYYQIRDREWTIQAIRSSIVDSFKSQNNWIVLSGFVVTMLPYLVWSFVEYGSPISVFTSAWAVSGARDAFLTYANGWSLYILPPLYIGAALFVWKNKIRKFENIFPIVFFLALFLPLQFFVANKETRFLLPVIPFLAIICGRGLYKLKELDVNWNKAVPIVLAVIILASVLMLPDKISSRNPMENGLTTDGWHPPIEDASNWLKQNTDNDTVVYTNYRYPPIGYYSKRKVVWVSPANSLDQLKQKYLDSSGYVYYSNKSPHENPSFEDLSQDPEFELRKDFEKTVYLFYFERDGE